MVFCVLLMLWVGGVVEEVGSVFCYGGVVGEVIGVGGFVGGFSLSGRFSGVGRIERRSSVSKWGVC